MKLKREFALVEAFEFTQAMYDKKEPVPHGVEVVWQEHRSMSPFKKNNPSIEPILEDDPTNRYVLKPGCWIIKCLDTGATKVYYDKVYMMDEFREVAN